MNVFAESKFIFTEMSASFLTATATVHTESCPWVTVFCDGSMLSRDIEPPTTLMGALIFEMEGVS